jgi:AraC family transcriptional regulator
LTHETVGHDDPWRTSLSQKLPKPNEEPLRCLIAGSYRVELLPRQPYETSFLPDRAVIGFAFESQDGRHAFASDRIRPFRTKPNSLAFTPSGCEVFSVSAIGGEYLRIVCEPGQAIDGVTVRQFSDVIDPCAIADAEALRSLLLGTDYAPLLAEEKAIALFERVQVELRDSNIESALAGWMTTARLRRIDEIIDRNMGEAISIRDMAAALDLSEGFFIRSFKAAVGKSPHSYLIDRRLARARDLIRNSPHDLREIALASGFSSHAHMSAAFRQRLGIAPRDLRA